MTKTSGTTLTALMCGAVTAQLVAGKATRDALFLMLLGAGALPVILVATGALSIVAVMAHGRAAKYIPPRALVSALFVVSGALYFAEWLLGPLAPALTAVIVYLHVSIVGPLLVSGVWLAVRPAEARGLAGAGALGGLAGALLTERMAAITDVSSMLVILGILQLFTSWLAWSLAVDGQDSLRTGFLPPPPASLPSPARSGWRVVAGVPHLRALGSLVLLGATSAAVLDCVFKARVVESFGLGDRLLGFFALYHAAVSLLSFLLQSGPGRAALERFGPGLTTGAPSIALLAGSLGSLVAPGLGSLLVARGAQSAFRVSWFRVGYELFFAPLPLEERRPARRVIDLGLDRLGDALGGCLVLVAVALAPTPAPVLVVLVMTMSVGAVFAGSRLNRWHVHMLEGRLVREVGGIDLTTSAHNETARIVANVRAQRGADTTLGTSETTLGSGATPTLHSPLLRDIRSLRSGSAERARAVLSREESLSPGLVTHVIPLLGMEDVADHAAFALRKVVEERVGELTDALLDDSRDVAVRRRLARVFSGGVSRRAADALLLALGSAPFEVRAETGRSLAAILNTNPRLRVDRERIVALVLREIAAARPVWETRHLLDPADPTPVDAFVRERTQESLSLVFTLLSLVLPRDPLLFAHRSLQRGDAQTRRTALEYLESVLPPAIRRELLPHLADRRELPPFSESKPAPGMVGTLA